MNRIRLAIADDHNLYRKSIIKFLGVKNEFQFVTEAETGIELLNNLERVTPDVILMDIQMPGMDGFHAIKEIGPKYPDIKIIAFTQYDQKENIIEMSRMGVKSFISKDNSEILPRVIKIIHDGGVYYPDVVARVIQSCLTSPRERNKYLKLLTPAEAKVLKFTCEGLSSNEIGRLMQKSPRTIEDHRASIYDKFDVQNKEQLIVLALKLDLV